MACLGEEYVFSKIDLNVGGVRIEIYIKEINL